MKKLQMNDASYTRCGMTVANPRWSTMDKVATLTFDVSIDGRIEEYRASESQTRLIVRSSIDGELYSRACHYCQMCWDMLN